MAFYYTNMEFSGLFCRVVSAPVMVGLEIFAMRVLVGCEWSGVVRDAFIARGHNAWSCDLDSGDGPHYQQDIMTAIDDPPQYYYDLIILFPPCTHLCVSGNRWYAGTQERAEAIAWTRELWWLATERADKVVLENPVGVLSSAWRPPDQYIQPWEYGHGETKKTGLWLHNLPKLTPTDVVSGREENVWRMGPSPDRAKRRGKTYQGIADAMAEQWGKT